MMPKRKNGYGKWVVILLVVGVGGFLGWRWYQKRSAEEPIEYKTAAIGRGDITQAVTANGQINPVKNVAVGSQVSGIIIDIKVDYNSRVTNGQVIAQIDPSTYQQNLTQAEAELSNTLAGLEMAELNMRRAKALFTNSLISASEYDQTLVSLHQAQSVVKMREALVKRAKVDLERTTIYAPVDGIVIARLVDVGQTVAANFNAPTLFTIANDLRQMRIEAMVSEADVGGVEEGQQVSFSVDAFPGRKFNGQVTQVRFAPVTNQNVVNYTAVVGVNNEDLKLRPGMTANASIIIAEKQDVLRIPNAAFRFRPPEGAIPRSATNSPAGGTNKTAIASGPAGDGQGAGSPEERQRRMEGMSPEQREQMRARRMAGGARGGGEGAASRTVYVFEKGTAPVSGKTEGANLASLFPGGDDASGKKPVLKPVSIKTGISDGGFTEVLSGLNEGDVVVTGVEMPQSSTAGRPPGGGSPFGGPPFGGGGMRPR